MVPVPALEEPGLLRMALAATRTAAPAISPINLGIPLPEVRGMFQRGGVLLLAAGRHVMLEERLVRHGFGSQMA